MTITVNGPGGVTVNFPDGTDSDTINSVMSHATGANTDAAAQPKTDYHANFGDVGMAALRGIPVAGGLIERFSSPESQAQYKAFDESRPLLSGAAKIGGGIASLAAPLSLPGKAGQLAARGLGLTGDTLGRQILNSSISGGVLSAADAAARGTDIGTNAEIGAGLGAAGPIAGRVIGGIASPVINTIEGLRNPAGVAAKAVGKAIQRDVITGGAGLTPAEFNAAQTAGMPVTNLERGGELTRALARSAANTSPEGRQALNAAIDPRFEAQATRINQHLDNNFNYPDATAAQAALEQVARTTNNAAYKTAYEQGQKGLWSPELERLAGSDAVSSAMQAAAKNAKDEAIVSGYGAMNPRISFTQDGRIQFNKGPNGVPTYPDLQYWDLVRRELGDAAQRAGRGTSEARRLNNFATSMNNELDRLVPSYQKARQGAAGFFGAQDALEAGQKFATQKYNNAEARQAVAKMSGTEAKLFQDGYVSKLKQVINETGDRRSVLNRIANSTAERERAIIAMGPTNANEFFDMLRHESIMDRARPALQGNSTTARQLAEIGLAGGAYGIGTGGDLTNPNPSALASAALALAAAKGHQAINQNVSRHIAELLVQKQLPKAAMRGGLLGNANIPATQVGTTLLGRAALPLFQ